MSESAPPWQTSSKIHDITITGYVFAWRDEQPVFVSLNGANDFFLPIFATADALRKMMAATNVEYDSIKQVDDQLEFLDSIPTITPSGQRIRIMVDPYIIANGNTRFREIFRD